VTGSQTSNPASRGGAPLLSRPSCVTTDPPGNEFVPRYANSNERGLATIMHLSGFAGALGPGPLSIIIPLVIWLSRRDDSPFLDDHGKEVLNFQISLWIWLAIAVLISILLMLVLVGFLLIFVLPALIGLVGSILMIVGAVKAYSGEYFRYPMTIRFLS